MSDILLIAESPEVREETHALLTQSHFATRLAATGSEGLKKLSLMRPSIVLVETAMLEMSGFRVCELIHRSDRQLPVILLSSQESHDELVRALMLGADDCVPRSGGAKVLMARIRRTLMRLTDFDIEEESVSIGPVSIGLDSLTITYGGCQMTLTHTERDILLVLLQRQGAFVSRAELLSSLRGHDFICATGLLYTHIYNLRQKLGPAGTALVCDRSVGYCLKRTVG